MKEKTLMNYKNGHNCSQCLLKAFEEHYNRLVPKECYEMCKGVNTGYGIGAICSGLASSIMIFGLIFDKETVKRLRLTLLFTFNQKHYYTDCQSLKRKFSIEKDCSEILEVIAQMTEEIIEKNL